MCEEDGERGDEVEAKLELFIICQFFLADVFRRYNLNDEEVQSEDSAYALENPDHYFGNRIARWLEEVRVDRENYQLEDHGIHNHILVKATPMCPLVLNNELDALMCENVYVFGPLQSEHKGVSILSLVEDKWHVEPKIVIQFLPFRRGLVFWFE